MIRNINIGKVRGEQTGGAGVCKHPLRYEHLRADSGQRHTRYYDVILRRRTPAGLGLGLRLKTTRIQASPNAPQLFTCLYPALPRHCEIYGTLATTLPKLPVFYTLVPCGFSRHHHFRRGSSARNVVTGNPIAAFSCCQN